MRASSSHALVKKKVLVRVSAAQIGGFPDASCSGSLPWTVHRLIPLPFPAPQPALALLFRAAQKAGPMARPQGAGRLRRNFLTRPTPSCRNSSFPVCGTSQGGTRLRTKSETFPVFSLEAAQKGLATRPQAKQSPEAYPLGYVEDGCETRTTLRAFFSSPVSRCRLVDTYR